mmetsp:Transcript_23225/g.39916  ORF Transcript_23225/g.39916 Transcript_23225/m.39916 type:complete len:159 (+) Transcript_23225:351-827(+)
MLLVLRLPLSPHIAELGHAMMMAMRCWRTCPLRGTHREDGTEATYHCPLRGTHREDVTKATYHRSSKHSSCFLDFHRNQECPESMAREHVCTTLLASKHATPQRLIVSSSLFLLYRVLAAYQHHRPYNCPSSPPCHPITPPMTQPAHIGMLTSRRHQL